MEKKHHIWLYPILLLGLAVFITPSCDKDDDTPANTVTDVDGNVYKTVTIGTQTWMAENLKTTKYNDGTAIPLVSDSAAWIALSTPGYCWYNNDEAANKATYGALYNWFVVNTGKLSPTGWHVPTDAEWTVLTDYLGGLDVAGGKLKDTVALWLAPNTGATNESGFTALPAGDRRVGGFDLPEFGDFGYYVGWWSTSEIDNNTDYVWIWFVGYDYGGVYREDRFKTMGLSIRCIKDN